MSELNAMHASQAKMRRPLIASAGLTLLEVIVALVLLSTTGVALISWMSHNLRTANQLQVLAAQARLEQDAMGLLASIDPSVDGEAEFNNLRLEWRTSPFKATVPNRAFDGVSAGAWRAGVYLLRVRARDAATGTQISFEVLRSHSRGV